MSDPFAQGIAMAVVHGGAMVAAAILHNYDAEAGVIQISAASDDKRWMTRPVLRGLFGYAFNELACQAVVQRCDTGRNDLARMFKAYGFKRYDIPRLRGRGKAEAVYVLSDDDWRASKFQQE